MALKKAEAPKASSKKAATTKKAAPEKAAPENTKAPAAAGKPKPAAAKKAPAVKLTDNQARVLGSVHQSGEAGYAAGKGEAKVLESLFKKKLVKRGKKVDGAARFLVTKAGAKHVPAPAPTAPAPVVAPPAAEPVSAPSPTA